MTTRILATTTLILALLGAPPSLAQERPVPSQVFRWNDLPATDREARPILEGSTTDLAYLAIEAVTLGSGQAPFSAGAGGDLEELLIVKEGALKVGLGGATSVIGPGSVVLLLAGDAAAVENAGEAPVTFYRFRYRAPVAPDAERGARAGGSFVVDWNDVVMEPTQTGGRRQHFDRATSVFDRFEMHVSTLGEGLTNHATHTHRAEEMVLILKGEVEMQIGDTWHRAVPGDLVFLASEIPHALRNTGAGQAEYFAFQWQ